MRCLIADKLQIRALSRFTITDTCELIYYCCCWQLFTRNLAVVNSGSAGNTSTDNDDDKKSKRGRSPSAAAEADDTSTEIERNQTNDESEFGMSWASVRVAVIEYSWLKDVKSS